MAAPSGSTPGACGGCESPGRLLGALSHVRVLRPDAFATRQLTATPAALRWRRSPGESESARVLLPPRSSPPLPLGNGRAVSQALPSHAAVREAAGRMLPTAASMASEKPVRSCNTVGAASARNAASRAAWSRGCVT